MRVLITDAQNRVALAVARALAADGIEVTAAAERRFAARTPLAFASRAVRRRVVLPDLGDGVDAYVASLLDACAGHAVVLPIAINAVLAVAGARAAFASRGVAVPLPPLESLRRANDKAAVAELARACGILSPRTMRVTSLDDVREAAAAIRFPEVLKIAVDEGLYLEPAERYDRVEDARELEAAFERLGRCGAPLVAQEAIAGTGYGYSALCGVGGAVCAAVAHRRVREFPARGGPSSCCESVREPDLESAARRLFSALGWSGVAMAEFRRDAQGRFWLLEVNPRFWGTLPLALACGINLPSRLCRMAVGEATPACHPAPAGVRVRWLLTDFLSAAGAGVSGVWSERGWRGFVRDLIDARVSDGIFDAGDPRPGMVYVLERAGSWL